MFLFAKIYEKKTNPREIDVTWKDYSPQPCFNSQRRVLRLTYQHILYHGELDFMFLFHFTESSKKGSRSLPGNGRYENVQPGIFHTLS